MVKAKVVKSTKMKARRAKREPRGSPRVHHVGSETPEFYKDVSQHRKETLYYRFLSPTPSIARQHASTSRQKNLHDAIFPRAGAKQSALSQSAIQVPGYNLRATRNRVANGRMSTTGNAVIKPDSDLGSKNPMLSLAYRRIQNTINFEAAQESRSNLRDSKSPMLSLEYRHRRILNTRNTESVKESRPNLLGSRNPMLSLAYRRILNTINYDAAQESRYNLRGSESSSVVSDVSSLGAKYKRTSRDTSRVTRSQTAAIQEPRYNLRKSRTPSVVSLSSSASSAATFQKKSPRPSKAANRSTNISRSYVQEPRYNLRGSTTPSSSASSAEKLLKKLPRPSKAANRPTTIALTAFQEHCYNLHNLRKLKNSMAVSAIVSPIGNSRKSATKFRAAFQPNDRSQAEAQQRSLAKDKKYSARLKVQKPEVTPAAKSSESESKSESEPNSECRSESQSEYDSESKSKSEAEYKFESDFKSESESGSESESEAKVKIEILEIQADDTKIQPPFPDQDQAGPSLSKQIIVPTTAQKQSPSTSRVAYSQAGLSSTSGITSHSQAAPRSSYISAIPAYADKVDEMHRLYSQRMYPTETMDGMPVEMNYPPMNPPRLGYPKPLMNSAELKFHLRKMHVERIAAELQKLSTEDKIKFSRKDLIKLGERTAESLHLNFNDIPFSWIAKLEMDYGITRFYFPDLY